MNGMMKRGVSSATGTPRSSDEDEACTLPAFGYPKANHGWVKCNSKTFPGQDYYFNVESACSTWIRPVSRFVPTPLVRPQNRTYDEDFLEATPIGVSDIEDDDDDEDEDFNNNCEIKIEKTEETENAKSARERKKEARERKIYNDVLFKLYHIYGAQWNVDENEDVKPFAGESSPCDRDDFDDDTSRDYEMFLPEAIYSSGSEGDTTESLNAISHNNSALSESFGSLCESHSWGRKSPESYVSSRRVADEKSSGTFKTPSTTILSKWKSPKKCPTPRKSLSSKNTSFEIPENREDFEVPQFDRPISNSSDSEDDDDSDDSETVKRNSSSAESTLSDEACRELEWSLDDEDEDDVDYAHVRNCENGNSFALPKLKAIEFSDLLTGPLRRRNGKKSRKRKARRNIEGIDKRPAKKVIKTVCVLNGITTVNYDYLAPQLPEGVVMTNLSDSGSSACYEVWRTNRDNETTTNPSRDEKNEASKHFYLTDDIFGIADPYLSESSTSSERSVGGEKPRAKKRLKSVDITANSESDSSDSSSSSSCSSSGSSTSSRNDDERTPLSRVAREDVNKDSDSIASSSPNSDKSWIFDGSEGDDC